MRIERAKVDNFGKLNQREFRFGPGINVIYGENEGGKSTLHAFFRGMFYGLPRMRGRAARNDAYSRYEPWENPGQYGGRLWLECGGKTFRLNRDFRKDKTAAELVCETDGELLCVEDGDLSVLLGGASEVLYDNTVSVGQLRGITDQNLAQELRNFMAGYENGQDAGLNLDRAREKLRRQRREVLSGIEEERQRREEGLKRQEEKIREHQLRMEQLEMEWKSQKKAFSDARNLSKPEKTTVGAKKARSMAAVLAVWMLLFILGIWQGVPFWGLLLWTVMGAGLLAAFFWVRRREEKLRESELQIQSEQELRRQKIQWKAEELWERMQEEQKLLENLRTEYEQSRREAAAVSPEQVEADALELAEQTLVRLGDQMQGKISRRLQERISEIFSELTDGKYRRVSLDETMKLGVHTEERYVPADRLSRGTLEQIYFSLRMAANEVLCAEEPLPLILDEVFAMYDDRRLASCLRWLADCGRQVLICTCQDREERLLKRLGIPYQKVKLVGSSKESLGNL